MASDLYDRILRVERRLRAIDLDSLSHRQRANAFALIGGASRRLLDQNGEIRGDEESGGCGYLDIYVFDGSNNPLQGVDVSAALQPPGQSPISIGNALTDADGHTALGIPQGGVYVVSAFKAGYPTAGTSVYAPCGGPTTVALKLANPPQYFAPCNKPIGATLNLNDSAIGDIDLNYDSARSTSNGASTWTGSHAAPKTGSPWTIHYELWGSPTGAVHFTIYGMSGTTVDSSAHSGGAVFAPTLTCTPLQITGGMSYSAVSDFYNDPGGGAGINYKITEK